MLVVPQRSRQPSLALELARSLVEVKNAVLVTREAKSVLPAARAAMEETTLVVGEGERVFLSQLEWAQAPPAHPRWVDMEEVLDTALEEAIYGRIDAAQALARAHRQLEEIIGGGS